VPIRWGYCSPRSYVRLGKALGKQVDNCFGPENLRLERGTNAHTGQPLWRVVCAGQPPAPDPLQGFEPHLEPGQEDVAGDAGDQMASQAEMVVQEEMTPALFSAGQDAGRRPAAGDVQEHGAVVREEHPLLQPSPALPAAREAVVQQGTGAARHHGELTKPESEEASAQRCEGVPLETGWCAAHQERAEILRVGALLGYPVLSYVPEHTTVPGETAWMQFLQYPQCHRLAELLLGYLREQYPEHFPPGAARFGSTTLDMAGRKKARRRGGTQSLDRCHDGTCKGAAKWLWCSAGDAHEEGRTSRVWCLAHQERSETMRMGLLLEPEDPAVEDPRGHTMCQGRELLCMG
jgi:hypothetical protein